MGKDRIIVDIDGTICTLTSGAYENAMPYCGAIELLNTMHKKGVSIVYFTGRGWHLYDYTLQQLKEWGCMFDQLICGKPLGMAYIDDLSHSSVLDFIEEVKKHD